MENLHTQHSSRVQMLQDKLLQYLYICLTNKKHVEPKKLQIRWTKKVRFW